MKSGLLRAAELCEQQMRSSWNSDRTAQAKLCRDLIRAEAAALPEEDSRLLVPVEPTEAMMKAGDDAILDGLQKAQIGCPYGLHPDHASHDVYKRMIDAARRET